MLKKTTKVETNKDIFLDIDLLSDIHADNKTKYEWLIKHGQNLKEKKPNYIVILGDMLNNGIDIESAKRLSDIFYEYGKIAPIIMIDGNHDCLTHILGRWLFIYNDDLVAMKEKIDNMYKSIPNLHFLENENILLDDKVNFSGLVLPAYYYVDEYNSANIMKESISSNFKQPLDKDKYNIFLSHTPVNLMDKSFMDGFEYFDTTDLVLAGHVHNGLVPAYLEKLVYKNYGFIITSKGKIKLFPNNVKGKVKINKNTTGIITNPFCTISSDKKKISKLNSLYPPIEHTVKIRKRTR